MNTEIPNSYETSNANSSKLNMYFDMMRSPAWKSLTLRQQGLYLRLKLRVLDGKVETKVLQYPHEFTFSVVDATKPGPNGEKPLYGNKNTFFKDLDALIDAGFIRVDCSGYRERKATTYGFSERWREYPEEIPKCERRINAFLNVPRSRREDFAVF